MLFDTHTHIQFTPYKDDRDEVIARAEHVGVIMNLVGTQRDTSEKAIALAEQHEHMYASIGIHPIQHDVVDVEEEMTAFRSRGEQWDETFFDTLAQHPKVIAIGETGLDKFHIRHDKTIEDIFAKQITLFMQHYALAKKHELPLVIHVRDAHSEMIELLQSLGEPINGTIHCFTGNWKQAEAYLSMGLHLGFTGVITFPPKKTDPQPQLDLWEVVKHMPLNRLLLETDAPYLTPQIKRGERNEPALVAEVAKQVALLRGISYEEVAEETTNNAKKLFLAKV